MTCREPDCARATKARGWCDTHYRRWKRANPGVAGWAPAEERLWQRVDRRGPDECWPFSPPLDAYGYGYLSVDGVNTKAHRYAYTLLVGPLGDDETLDHLCRNRACCNPAHADPVSRGENVRRGEAPAMVAHRTNICQRGLHSLNDNPIVNKRTGARQCRPCSVAARLRREARVADLAVL